MQIIYPTDDFNSKIVDETYLEESIIAKSLGYKIGILDISTFKDSGKGFKLIDLNEPSLWRGWMLKENEYLKISNQVNLIVNPEDYISCHHINHWYPIIKNYTPETKFFKENDDFSNLLWNNFFVKDFVKSNTGKLGSIAHNIEEMHAILAELKKYRGEIEGGICIRKTINILPNSEKRYFVINGKPYSNNNEPIPDILNEIASQMKNNLFYSVDIAFIQNINQPIVIEIGDGQVSDIKEWNLESFKVVLEALNGMTPTLNNKLHSFKK